MAEASGSSYVVVLQPLFPLVLLLFLLHLQHPPQLSLSRFRQVQVIFCIFALLLLFRVIRRALVETYLSKFSAV